MIRRNTTLYFKGVTATIVPTEKTASYAASLRIDARIRCINNAECIDTVQTAGKDYRLSLKKPA